MTKDVVLYPLCVPLVFSLVEALRKKILQNVRLVPLNTHASSSVLFTFFLSFFFSCSWPVIHNLHRTRLIKCRLTSIYHLHRLAINSSTYRPYTLPAYYPNVPARLHHCRLHLPTTLTTSPRPLIRHCQYGIVPRL